MKETGDTKSQEGADPGRVDAHLNKIAEEAGVEWPPGLLDTIIDLFHDDAPKQIGELQVALQRGDCDKLRAVSHKVRGSSDVLGTSSISALAAAVEEAAKRGDLEQAAESVPKLVKELQELLTELTGADIKEGP